MIKDLLSALDDHAAQRPGAPWLHFMAGGNTTTYSFAETRDRSLVFAARFAALGLPPESVVFIILRHRAELYFAFLGAMQAGLIPAFLPFPTPKQDADLYWRGHRELFARVEPGAILTYAANMPALREALGGLPTIVMDVDQTDASMAPQASLPHYLDSRTALLQHSSGTTGLKKGVMLRFSDIRLQVASYAGQLGMGPDDTVVTWLPLYHDMGLLSSFLTPLTLGAQVVSMDAFEWVSRPAMLLRAVEQHRASFAWMPNFAFNHIARLRPQGETFDLRSLRALISCSEPCKAETVAAFAAAFREDGLTEAQLGACYAMAETVFAVTQSPIGTVPRAVAVDGPLLDRTGAVRVVEASAPGARAFVSNGPALPGLEVRIATPEGPVPVVGSTTSTSSGEIEIRGAFLFAGYYRNPEATSEAFDGEWYRTGDVGFVEAGELFICGRRKEMLIVHGRNYYANDVEEALGAVPGVKPGRGVAFAVFDAGSQSEEAVVVVETEVDEAEHAALRRQVKQVVFDRLELTLRSVRTVAPGWLVKTTSGKISRKENLVRYLELEAAAKSARADRSRT